MADIRITAVFSDENTARQAADALSLTRGGGLGLTVSTRSASGASTGNNLPGLLREGAVSGPAAPRRGHSCILRASCGPDLEAYVVGELAALGAEKIDVQVD